MDVTLYSIHKKKDGSGQVYYVPALYLDTLKVSTVEKTGDNSWAQGGIGNGKLINWDYNKQINVTLEDALCTPASLGMCWSGILSADWKDSHINIDSDFQSCKNPVNRVSRLEKAFYPRASGNNSNESVVGNLIPLTDDDRSLAAVTMGIPLRSEVTDGVKVTGTGAINGHNYRWRLVIETGVKSVAQIPDRFFDTTGRAYPIDWNTKVSVFNGAAPTSSNFKDAIIYKIGNPGEQVGLKPHIIFDAYQNSTGTDGITMSLQEYLTTYGSNLSTTGTPRLVNTTNNEAEYITETQQTAKISEASYLAIVVDNNDVYHAFVAAPEADAGTGNNNEAAIVWSTPETPVNVNQFKALDMWLQFDGINALNYFLLTKYEDNINGIVPVQMTAPLPKADGTFEYSTDNGQTWVDVQPSSGSYIRRIKESTSEVDNTPDTEINEYGSDTKERRDFSGKLWAYVNPRTMQPYDDDYWFHQHEPYYIKSLTISQENKQIKANKITVLADQWPGMYMLVGETYIRDRDTGNDQRMQLKFPLCKVKADQTLTLQADGDPTTFSMSLEIAKPQNGAMMEITAYEVAKKMVLDKTTGCYYAVDGSSEVLSE